MQAAETQRKISVLPEGQSSAPIHTSTALPSLPEENLGAQPVELGIVKVLALSLSFRDAESERAQGVGRQPGIMHEPGVDPRGTLVA
jgi:hypothetical protein